MKRRLEVNRQDILDRLDIGSVAGVSSGMMTQYLAMARIIAVEQEFPEYQAMALTATRQPDGNVYVDTPFEEARAQLKPNAVVNEVVTSEPELNPCNKCTVNLTGFLIGATVMGIVWIIVEVVKSL